MRTKNLSKRMMSVLLCCIVLLGIVPAVAFADGDPAGDAVYVSSTGDDTVGKGTQDQPYASLAKAVNEASDGSTIYLLSDLTLTDCARFYNKNLTIKSVDGSHFTVFRGTNVNAINDPTRSWYNPAMIEVDIDANGQSASLRLENITLDDQGLKNGTKFKQAGANTGDNTAIVQDAMIASYKSTASITLGDGAVLKNFGGMSAVRIASGSLTMEAGSQIVDDAVTNRTKTSGDYGPAGAVWSQSGVLNMESGSQISNVIGRALYADGGVATINGSISGIVPDIDMWQGGVGLAVHARNDASVTLGESGAISEIYNPADSIHADRAIVVAAYQSNFETKNGSVVSDITNCTTFILDDQGTNYSHSLLLNGKVTGCSTPGSMTRAFMGQITIGPDALITGNSAKGAGGLFYSNNGVHYQIEGKITNNTATSGMFYLANQSGGRVEAVMKDGAEISGNTGIGVRVNNGSLFKMEGGKITQNTGIGVWVTGKNTYTGASFEMKGGEITDNTSYGMMYEFRGAGTKSVINLTQGTVANNNEGGDGQIFLWGGTASDAYEHVYLQEGMSQGPLTIDAAIGILTLEEDYPEVNLGTSSTSADNKIIQLVKEEAGQEDWQLYGWRGLWFKPEQSADLTFSTNKLRSDKEMYAAYIPVDENGNPAADAQVTLVRIYNLDTVEVPLHGLTVGQPYALRFVESNTPVSQYTVTFDVNGGAFPDDTIPVTQTVDEGDFLNGNYWADWTPRYLDAQGEEAYRFDGWYVVDANGEVTDTLWSSTDRVLEDMTLRAKWVDDSVVVPDTGGEDDKPTDKTPIDLTVPHTAGADAAKTSDATNAFLWVVLLLVAASGLVVGVTHRSRKN